MRDALDWLRDSIKDDFEFELGKILKDPWNARDAYIEIILDHSPEKVKEWLYTHSGRNLNDNEAVRAMRLLEMQRSALLMYTSCGWFFDDIAGIETVQILCYASQVIDLAKELFGKEFENEFKNRIELAMGNTEKYPNGRIVYEELVEPVKLTPEKRIAQLAIYSFVLEDPLPDVIIDIRNQEGSKFCVGYAIGDATLSFRGRPFFFAAALDKEHGLICGIKELPNDSDSLSKAGYEKLCRKFTNIEVFNDSVHMNEIFGKNIFSIQHLTKDMRQYLLSCLIENETNDIENSVRNMVGRYENMFSLIGKSDVALPTLLQSTAGVLLNADIERIFESEELDATKLLSSIDKANNWGVKLNITKISYTASFWLITKMYELEKDFPSVEIMNKIIEMLELMLTKLQWDLSLSETQNTYYRIFYNNMLNVDGKQKYGEDVYGLFFKIGMLLRFSESIFQN